MNKRTPPTFDDKGIPSACDVCGKLYCDHPWDDAAPLTAANMPKAPSAKLDTPIEWKDATSYQRGVKGPPETFKMTLPHLDETVVVTRYLGWEFFTLAPSTLLGGGRQNLGTLDPKLAQRRALDIIANRLEQLAVDVPNALRKVRAAIGNG